MSMNTNPSQWRNERQIRGLQSQIQGAINASENGAYIEIDITTGRAIIDICKQARHTEKGHEDD